MNSSNPQHCRKHSLGLSVSDLQELTGGNSNSVPLRSNLDFDEDLEKLMRCDEYPFEKFRVESKAIEVPKSERNVPFDPYNGSDSYQDAFYPPHVSTQQCDSVSTGGEQTAGPFARQHSIAQHWQGINQQRTIAQHKEVYKDQRNVPFVPYNGSNSYQDAFYPPHVSTQRCDSVSIGDEQPAGPFAPQHSIAQHQQGITQQHVFDQQQTFAKQHTFSRTLSGHPKSLSRQIHLNDNISENPRFLSQSVESGEDLYEKQSIVSHSTPLSVEKFSTPSSLGSIASHSTPFREEKFSTPSSLALHFTLCTEVGNEAPFKNLVELMKKSERSRRHLRKMKVHTKSGQESITDNIRGSAKGISYADIKSSRSKKREGIDDAALMSSKSRKKRGKAA